MPVRSDGIFAIDMTFTNQKLMMKGVDPIRAVIGQDVLRYHQAVIDMRRRFSSKRNRRPQAEVMLEVRAGVVSPVCQS